MNNVANRLDLIEQNTQLKGLLATKNNRIQHLEELLLSYRHQQFGASSEANPHQGGLFNEQEDDGEENPSVEAVRD